MRPLAVEGAVGLLRGEPLPELVGGDLFWPVSAKERGGGRKKEGHQVSPQSPQCRYQNHQSRHKQLAFTRSNNARNALVWPLCRSAPCCLRVWPPGVSRLRTKSLRPVLQPFCSRGGGPHHRRWKPSKCFRPRLCRRCLPQRRRRRRRRRPSSSPSWAKQQQEQRVAVVALLQGQ